MEVLIGIEVKSFDVREAAGQLGVDLFLHVTWTDNRLKVCNCDDFNNDHSTVFNINFLEKIFVPSVAFVDAVEPVMIDYGDLNDIIWITHDDISRDDPRGARIVWRQRMNVILPCNWNMKWFPQDVNMCPILFSSEFDFSHRLNLTIGRYPDLDEDHPKVDKYWVYAYERLRTDSVHKHNFQAYTRFGIEDRQNYTGFQVVFRRDSVDGGFHVDLTKDLFPWILLIFGSLTVAPATRKLFSWCITLKLIGGIIGDALNPDPKDPRLLYYATHYHYIFVWFFFLLCLSLYIDNVSSDRKVAFFFRLIAVAAAALYWFLVVAAPAWPPWRDLANSCPEHQKLYNVNWSRPSKTVQNMPGLCIHNLREGEGRSGVNYLKKPSRY